jgi:hypothetical protein
MQKAILALALAVPARAATGCMDSELWEHNNRDGLKCDWVKEYADKRCYVNGHEDGEPMRAMDACLDSCGMCDAEPGHRENAADLQASMCPYLINEFVSPNKVPCDEAFEQSPADLTVGAVGNLGPNLPANPTRYSDIDKCAVNVHWHLGAEHRNAGTFDIPGYQFLESIGRRRLAGDVTPGYFCQGYDEEDPKYTTEYEWKYCEDMHVGYTYEIHWPHSDAGPCGYMSDGLGGLFCTKMPTKAGVEGQVFVVVNDDSGDYDQPRLIEHMVDVTEDSDIAKYTGSSTGTSHDNEVCSPYNVQWHVDRACHLVSARSFDAMCKVMKEVHGMSKDLYPHGSRVLVDADFVTNKPMTRKLRGSASEEEPVLTGGWH